MEGFGGSPWSGSQQALGNSAFWVENNFWKIVLGFGTSRSLEQKPWRLSRRQRKGKEGRKAKGENPFEALSQYLKSQLNTPVNIFGSMLCVIWNLTNAGPREPEFLHFYRTKHIEVFGFVPWWYADGNTYEINGVPHVLTCSNLWLPGVLMGRTPIQCGSFLFS